MATLTPEQVADYQARLVSLRKARDSGVLIVRHGDTQTQFRNLKELQEIIADLESQIGENTGAVSPVRVRYARQTTKGL